MLVLIQAASLRSAGQAHATTSETELKTRETARTGRGVAAEPLGDRPVIPASALPFLCRILSFGVFRSDAVGEHSTVYFATNLIQIPLAVNNANDINYLFAVIRLIVQDIIVNYKPSYRFIR